MKVSIKTIRGEAHVFETSPEETIEQLKKKIEERMKIKSEFAKLIHKARHLPNDKTIQELGIADGDNIILMELKKHTLIGPQSEPSAGLAAPSPPLQPAVQPPASARVLVPDTPSVSSVSDSPQPPAQLDPNSEMVVGAQASAQTVRELVEMGFPQAEAERALTAAFFNRDRAVEYLLTGIPEGVVPAGTDAPSPAASAPASTPTDQITLTPQQMAQLQELVATPEFENIRQQALQNPQVLQELMGFLQQHRPDLLQLFQQHPPLLLAVITGQYQVQGETAEEGEATAELTPEDMVAIEMMQSFGFSAQQCVEAYLLCDKNQELAINYLLDEQNSTTNQNN